MTKSETYCILPFCCSTKKTAIVGMNFKGIIIFLSFTMDNASTFD